MSEVVWMGGEGRQGRKGKMRVGGGAGGTGGGENECGTDRPGGRDIRPLRPFRPMGKSGFERGPARGTRPPPPRGARPLAGARTRRVGNAPATPWQAAD